MLIEDALDYVEGIKSPCDIKSLVGGFEVETRNI
jgi:hypothetical protein